MVIWCYPFNYINIMMELVFFFYVIPSIILLIAFYILMFDGETIGDFIEDLFHEYCEMSTALLIFTPILNLFMCIVAIGAGIVYLSMCIGSFFIFLFHRWILPYTKPYFMSVKHIIKKVVNKFLSIKIKKANRFNIY